MRHTGLQFPKLSFLPFLKTGATVVFLQSLVTSPDLHDLSEMTKKTCNDILQWHKEALLWLLDKRYLVPWTCVHQGFPRNQSQFFASFLSFPSLWPLLPGTKTWETLLVKTKAMKSLLSLASADTTTFSSGSSLETIRRSWQWSYLPWPYQTTRKKNLLETSPPRLTYITCGVFVAIEQGCFEAVCFGPAHRSDSKCCGKGRTSKLICYGAIHFLFTPASLP